jgi:RNA polymerase sigma factor (sigma-70 family)
MASAQFAVVYRQIGRLFGAGTVAGLSEGQLLDRFIAGRDDDAFEAIVARHGPMVLSVCRALLRDPNDVDDAFQAVFLVLVRRAGSLRQRDRLGNWLYGVAHRVARRARSEATRRGRETTLADPVDPTEHDADGFDVRPLIHEEVNRLPASYREAILLCYFQGRTHEEAARELGWPVGTVRGRLARARDLLRIRLTRRGIAPASGTLVAALCREGRAAVPPSLLNTTTSAAASAGSLSAIATVAASARAIALSQGALETMSATKLKLATTCLVAAGVLSGSGVSAYQGSGAPATRPAQDATVSSRQALAKERVQLAQGIVYALTRSEKASKTSSEELALWRRRLYEARLAAGVPKAEAAQALVDATRDDVAEARALEKARVLTGSEVSKREFRRLEAEELLAELAMPPAAAPPAAQAPPQTKAQPQPQPQPQAQTKTAMAPRPFQQQWDEEAAPEVRLRAADQLLARMESLMNAPSYPKEAKRELARGIESWKQRRETAAQEVAADKALAQARLEVAEQAVAQIQREIEQTDSGEAKGELAGKQVGWETEVRNARQILEGPDFAYMSAVRGLDAAKAREAEARKRVEAGNASKLDELQARSDRITAEAILLKQTRARRIEKAKASNLPIYDSSGMKVGMGGGTGGAMGGSPSVAASPPPAKPGDVERNKLIEQKLEKRVTMNFPNEVTLGDLIAYVQEQTKDAKGKIIPIYVDPVGLQEAEKTTQSTVRLDLEDLPVRITLRLALDQLGLFYRVKEGMVFIKVRHEGDADYPGDPAPLPADLERNKAIEAALEKEVSMHFASETPLETVLEHVREETKDARGRKIPVYVDPISLQEAEKTMQSPINLDLVDVPLRTTLRLVLAQLNLEYKVEDGLLKVVATQGTPDEDQGPVNGPGAGMGGGFGGTSRGGLQ